MEELTARFARLVEDSSRSAIAERGSFSIAVPGGSAAEHLLPGLIGAPVDWPRVHVFWVDERIVPPDDLESNYRVARSAWLDHVPLPAEGVHRMRGDDPVPVVAAATYARILRERLGDPPRIDLVLLGMGQDGHVASLFPGHRLLRAWDRTVAALDDAPKPPARRITLTLPALTAARHVVVFAAGAAKSPAMQDVLENDESDLPVALATMGDGPTTFLLDTAAAQTRP
jgi:6-phosphogluconolactonase